MPAPDRPLREIARNRKAKRDYEILDTVEAGIVLTGTEVKSLRAGKVSLQEAYVKARRDGLWLVKAHIEEYTQANRFNHEPERDRKLLLRRREIQKLRQRVREKGLTLVPLRLYFRGPWAKLEIGVGRGRKLYDKRELVKKREAERAMRRAR